MERRLTTPEETRDVLNEVDEARLYDEATEDALDMVLQTVAKAFCAFFNEKSEEIIDTITDEKYIQVLTLAGVENAEEEVKHKDVDTLAGALSEACINAGMEFSPEEFYEEVMKN